MSSEKKNQEDSHLIEGLSNDVASHYRGNDSVVSGVGFLIEKLLRGGLSGQGQSTASVHNEVNPEHLDTGERGVSQDDRADEDDEHGDTVHCELELKELSYIGVNVSAPFDGCNNRCEVVIKDDNV